MGSITSVCTNKINARNKKNKQEKKKLAVED